MKWDVNVKYEPVKLRDTLRTHGFSDMQINTVLQAYKQGFELIKDSCIKSKISSTHTQIGVFFSYPDLLFSFYSNSGTAF